ncbi:hypothetical protein ACFFVB_12505 [Formosa undariae]|uniref:Exo-alpha-sialidase n=1 Tax=Formosa undariae TaxID=1325436 RepID=A0ABV5F3D7_9FLAO
MKSLNLLILVTLFLSCNSNKKKPILEEKHETIVHSISFPGDEKSELPHLTTNTGNAMLSWVTRLNDSTTQFNYSTLINQKWEAPKPIITGTNWFVNWADYPSITENNGNLLSHFLKKSSNETFSYDIKLNVLPEGESEWETALPLHTDGTKTEHGFVTVLPFKENAFFVTWLDGRGMSMDHAGEHMSHNGSMSIRAAEVSKDGLISNKTLLDGKTCSCCQTTAAITKNGPIVLYRDRTDEEIRDIAITRYIDGKWTEPKFIYNDGWKINGCPVNGPKVAALENNVAVTWFTAANDTPLVKLIFSKNGGEDFSEPIIISNSEVLGRVDIELIDSDNAIVSWMETADETTYLKAMKVNSSGKKYTPLIISTLNDSRKTGFPQMQYINDNMYFAWTAIANDISTIKTVFVPLEAF